MNSLSQQYDIAILKLYKDVVLNDKVQVACLPIENSNNYPNSNVAAYAVGKFIS
jgi:hypothetical protein